MCKTASKMYMLDMVGLHVKIDKTDSDYRGVGGGVGAGRLVSCQRYPESDRVKH